MYHYRYWPNFITRLCLLSTLFSKMGFMFLGISRHLMTSWHLNIWKYKIWLSQERKELSKWKEKHFVSQVLSFRLTKQASENVADTTFKFLRISYHHLLFITLYFESKTPGLDWESSALTTRPLLHTKKGMGISR